MPAAVGLLGCAGRAAGRGRDQRAGFAVLSEGRRLNARRGAMVDYYPILARAMSAPEARDPQWRRGVYERARQMLVTQLLARRPATPPDVIAAEQSGLDSAIRRIEVEMSRPARGAVPRDKPIDDADGDIADPSASAPDQGPLKTPLRLTGISLFAVAIVVAAIGAGGYMFWVQHAHKASPPPVK